MNTNDTDNTYIKNKRAELIYEALSYKINGVLFSIHNELGPYAKEKQYLNVAARIFKEQGLLFESEVQIGNSGNRIDGIVEKKILLEFKAKRLLTKEDYYQTQRYLQKTGLKLGILVNFRDKILKPKRIIRIENWKNHISIH